MEMTPEEGLQPGTQLTDDRGIRSAYAAHGTEIYRFCLRGLGETGAAEEAVQETFLRAWQAAARYDSTRGSLRVWLFAIARNVIIDLHRKRGSFSYAQVPADEGMVSSAVPPVADSSGPVLNRQVIDEALGKLSDEHREVLVDKFFHDKSYDEVAEETGVPKGTLRSRTFYALKALRVALDEMGVTL